LLVHHDENPDMPVVLGTIFDAIAGDLFVELVDADLAFCQGFL